MQKPSIRGRSFYTGLGHTEESYDDPDFTNLLLGAIRYTANRSRRKLRDQLTEECKPERHLYVWRSRDDATCPNCSGAYSGLSMGLAERN